MYDWAGTGSMPDQNQYDELVPVRETQGAYCPASCRPYISSEGASLEWAESDTVEMRLWSRTLGRDELFTVAEALVVEGRDVRLALLPGAVSVPLVELGRHVSSELNLSSAELDSTDPARPGFLGVSTIRGGDAELHTELWPLDDLGRVEIRGHDGWIGTSTDAPVSGTNPLGDGAVVTHVVWREASDMVVHVNAVGLTEDEVIDAIESLRPATEAGWRTTRAAEADH